MHEELAFNPYVRECLTRVLTGELVGYELIAERPTADTPIFHFATPDTELGLDEGKAENGLLIYTQLTKQAAQLLLQGGYNQPFEDDEC